MTTEEIFEAAMSLPDDSKATLVERLVAHLATHVEPKLERAHLEVATRRRDEILSGKVEALDGEAIDREQAIEGIQRGVAAMERGEGRPAREVFEDIRQRHGIPREA